MRSALNSKIIASVFTNFGVLLAIVTTTLIQARGYLKGFNYGDPFDGRLMVVLHEHWWHFLRGERPFLNTYFFYPYDRGLGYSDTFFLQGFFYSFARLLDFDLVDSWALATISILALSNIGLALLAKLLIHTYLLRLSFIIITGTSFTFFAFLNMYPNVAGYGLVSFLAYFGIKFFSSKSSAKDRNVGLFGLSLTFPILLLSAWYAAFFSAVYIFLFIVFKLFHDKFSSSNYTVSFLNLFRNLNKINIIFSSVVFTSLASLWVYIYLPVASNVDRDVQELREGSPKFDQLANGSALGGGFFRSIYEFLGYSNFSQLIQDQNGITLTLFLSWTVIGILLFIAKNPIFSSKIWTKQVWFISTCQIIFFLQFGEYSLFQFLWQIIPPLNAIRVPARILILFSGVIILLLHVLIDTYLEARSAHKNIFKFLFVTLILMIIFLEQIRFETVRWVKKDYEPNNLFTQAELIQSKCDFFILYNSGGWWSNQISAMYLSAQLNVPTANGYSGGYPKKYPIKDWHYEGDIFDILTWSEYGQDSNRGCIVSENYGILTSLDRDSILLRSGFSPTEADSKGNFWNWTESNTALVMVQIPENKSVFEIEFKIKLSSCLNSSILRIYREKDNLIFDDVIDTTERTLKLSLDNNPTTINELRLEVSDQYCNFPDDPRNLYFQISNYYIR